MDELLSKEFVHEVYGFAQAQGSKIDVPEADMVELLKAFVKAGREHVKNDRANFFKGMTDELKLAATNIGILEKAVSEHGHVIVTPDQIWAVTRALSLQEMMMYWGFVDNLLMEEEDSFRYHLAQYHGAWVKFFSTCAKRHPELADTCEKARVHMNDLVQIWGDLFTGEVESLLHPEYARAWADFSADLDLVVKGV